MSVFNSSRLAGKTVLVTGGSAGIGAATAILFGKAGANVIITGRRKEKLDEVATQIKAANKEGGTGKGGEVAAIVLDIQNRTAVSSIFDLIPDNLKKVDVLVNNAGMVLGREQVGDIKESDVDTMFETNVLGLITLTQIFVTAFKKQQSGHIIFLGSIAGKEPYAGGSIYTATKAAVASFAGSMMRELVNTPIRTTQICPGMVETEFSIVRFRGDKAAADSVYKDTQPLVAQDIAEEIVWAASRPNHVNIADVLIFPKCQASAGIVHRGPFQ
ncbi:NAD(P)-binding protein [Meredithblackwellia eburnea MCA 4105]